MHAVHALFYAHSTCVHLLLCMLLVFLWRDCALVRHHHIVTWQLNKQTRLQCTLLIGKLMHNRAHAQSTSHLARQVHKHSHACCLGLLAAAITLMISQWFCMAESRVVHVNCLV